MRGQRLVDASRERVAGKSQSMAYYALVRSRHTDLLR